MRRRYATLDDDALLTLARNAGDEGERRQAAAVLLARYHGRVYQWCAGQLGDPQRAEDAAQEVLLSAYRALPGFDGRARFGSWLFAIARNRCLSERRRRAFPRAEVEPDSRPATTPDPERELIERDARDALLRRLTRWLDPLEQEAVCLRYLERMPVDAITRVLDITQSSGARGVLQSARRKLRRAYPDREAFQDD